MGVYAGWPAGRGCGTSPSTPYTLKDARLNPEMAVRKEATRMQAGFRQTPRKGRVNLKKKGSMAARGTKGFSLIELLIVIAIMMIASAISIMAIQPMLQQ